ncbi:hypothetical protein AB0M46_11175 [Dactylosporangium sp. NPDC051485]|uniref:hypothetical protein n=1 Tax=Dactylosporangium sp. NPDC051485 TaxID=3154846 RepID=UPI00342A92F4
MSINHGDDHEDEPPAPRPSNRILIVSCALAAAILAAAIFIVLDRRGTGGSEAEPAAAGAPSPKPPPGPPTGDDIGLPSGPVTVVLDGETVTLQPGQIGALSLPVSLTDWAARLPRPVTLATAGTTRHGEVHLDKALAVVEVTMDHGDAMFKVDCQVRGDNDGTLPQPALDFLKACTTATLAAGEPIEAPTAHWLADRLRPVADRQAPVSWSCGWLQARLILDRSTADLELQAAFPGPPADCKEVGW